MDYGALTPRLARLAEVIEVNADGGFWYVSRMTAKGYGVGVSGRPGGYFYSHRPEDWVRFDSGEAADEFRAELPSLCVLGVDNPHGYRMFSYGEGNFVQLENPHRVRLSMDAEASHAEAWRRRCGG